MKRALTVGCILLIAGCRQVESKAALETARAFYSAALPLMGHGVPGDIHTLRPHISTQLAALLDQASEAEDLYYKRTGDEVPPMLEGDLFSSLAEGATSFKVLVAAKEGSHWICTVELAYRSPEGQEEPYVWMDRATLIREGGRWVVDDLALLSNDQKAPSESLQAVLRQVIKNGNDPNYK